MLHIQRFVCNPIQENCYIVHDDALQAVIIDCGAQRPEERRAIAQYIEHAGLQPVRLLCTHAHFDHVWGAQFVYDTYGLQPEMHSLELPVYARAPQQLEALLHRRLPLPLPPAGPCFAQGDELCFGHHALQVILTPGHTPGGVCLYCADEGVLFSGDSLFQHAIGRTDFEGGSEQALKQSLKEKILTLPPDVTVCPGHGPTTTIAAERAGNPYLQ